MDGAVEQPVYDISMPGRQARHWSGGASEVDVGTGCNGPSPTYEMAADVGVDVVHDRPADDIWTPGGQAHHCSDGAGVNVGTDDDGPSPTYEVAAAMAISNDMLDDTTYDFACL